MNKDFNSLLNNSCLICFDFSSYNLADRWLKYCMNSIFLFSLPTLKSSIKSHYESIESTTNLYDLYNQLIDVMRSTELIKDNENFSEELKKLQQAKETTTKKLKEECDDGNRFNVYMEFKEKLLVSYKSENALSTIETFNQLISKLIFC